MSGTDRGEPSPFRWRFECAGRSDPRGGEVEGFRSRLTCAVRAGHASGARFRWSIATGPFTPLCLETDQPSSARWITRQLMPLFSRGQWSALRGSPTPPGAAVRWHAAPATPWPETLTHGEAGMTLFEATVATLASAPAGVVCDWSFWPSRNGPAHASHGGSSGLERGVEPEALRRAGDRRPPPSRPPPVDRSPVWQSRCELRALDTGSARESLTAVALAMRSATQTSSGNFLRFRPSRWWTSRDGPAFALDERTVVSVFPSPWTRLPPEASPDPDRIREMLPIGRTAGGCVVGPLLEAEQGRHLAVLGETGMGKSSLLVTLARRALDSSGLILFDPLGETARILWDELGGRDRTRTVWIDPGSAVRINALEELAGTSADHAPAIERRVNDLVHSLRRVRSGRYPESSFWGPRLEEMLTRALRAAAALPGGTLVEAHALLAAQGRGFRQVPPEAMEPVRELADRIRERPEDADGARRLLYEVTRSETLVRALCSAHPTIAVADLVAPGRIVLISGEAARVGESIARYLLSVYLALVWPGLLARETSAKTFVILDEAQWFGHETLGEMLRLGRRRNVHVVVATQSIASLPEGVAEAVWTNVADFVAFRGSPTEAREFARAARGVDPESILALPRGEAAVLLGKGNAVRWVRTCRWPKGPAAGPGSGPSPVGSGIKETAELHRPQSPGSPCDPEARAPAGVDQVIAAVRDKVGNPNGTSPVLVNLAELRREVDPAGDAVRQAGARLGRARAIVRTGRVNGEPCWWIDPAGLFGPGVEAPLPGEPASEESEPS